MSLSPRTDFAAIQRMPKRYSVCTEDYEVSAWFTREVAVADADTLHEEDPGTEYMVVDNWHDAGRAVVIYTTKVSPFAMFGGIVSADA